MKLYLMQASGESLIKSALTQLLFPCFISEALLLYKEVKWTQASLISNPFSSPHCDFVSQSQDELAHLLLNKKQEEVRRMA